MKLLLAALAVAALAIGVVIGLKVAAFRSDGSDLKAQIVHLRADLRRVSATADKASKAATSVDQRVGQPGAFSGNFDGGARPTIEQRLNDIERQLSTTRTGG